jgi:hypothetical protein
MDSEILELLEELEAPKQQNKRAPKQQKQEQVPIQQKQEQVPIKQNKQQEQEIIKQKKPRTPAQIEAFKKVVAIREENRLKRKAEQEEEKKQFEKYKEDLIVKKAISIKKKQLKEIKPLQNIPDDETPIEEIKKKIQSPPVIKKEQPPAPVQQIKPIKPTFYFV